MIRNRQAAPYAFDGIKSAALAPLGVSVNTFVRDETKLKIISVNELFLLGDRYFFKVGCNNGNKRISKLFEYNYADNSIKEIASFNTGSINHVELYESQ